MWSATVHFLLGAFGPRLVTQWGGLVCTVMLSL